MLVYNYVHDYHVCLQWTIWAGIKISTTSSVPRILHLFIADDRPDLLKLLNLPSKSGSINIPEQIGTNYLRFGILLLNDKSGAEVKAIVTQKREDAEQINIEILRLWIGGKGKPLSWDTLIDVLKAIGLNTLASDIQDSLRHYNLNTWCC